MGLFGGKKRKRRRGGSRQGKASVTRTGAQRRRKQPPRRFFSRRTFIMLGTLGFWATIAGLIVLAYFMHDLPDISTLTKVNKAPTVVLYTKDKQIIGSSGEIYGEYIRYNEIPRDLIKALVATEDRNFFKHHGVDPIGLLRATFANMRAGHIVQGGSTLTQQLAKNIFLTPERSLKRKIQEVILAISMERKYTKQEIITVYLNRVYFGAGTFGIDGAARRYFAKSARDLMLPESAMIAGLLKAPTRYAPTTNPKLAIGRATQVLINMEDAGLINEGQLAAARKAYSSVTFPKLRDASGRRYFTDWILDQLPDYVGNIQSDLIVTTTFNPNLQIAAEDVVALLLTDKISTEQKVGQAALLSMTPDGAVQAMVGGRNYNTSQFNRAVQAKRQPGSSFKLFVYLAALEHGWNPSSPVVDAPLSINGWSPSNYDGGYGGEMTVRQAFAKSINTVAVQLSEDAGRQNVANMAYRLGFKGKIDPVPSLALGSMETTLMEMTTAFTHVAAGGKVVMPYGIESIRDVHGKVLYQRAKTSLGQALQPGIVQQMNSLLTAVVEEGTGRGASIGRPVAGKTGTSQDYRDAWFIGFTPQLVTGVWVGNDNNKAMRKVTGGALPARIWREYMKIAMEGQPVMAIPSSSGGSWWDGELGGEQRLPDGETLPGERPAPRQESLGKSFWDKLFDGEQESGNAPREAPQRIKR